jgi:hypothetical protein
MAFDASVPNAARVYDFFLGGKDNFAADRELAQKILAVLPDTADVCRANRDFLQRAVRLLAGEAGIRQFLDIGTGLPTMGNVHEVAQETAPDSRVAYVDYDPVVFLTPGRCWPTTRMSSRSRATCGSRRPSWLTPACGSSSTSASRWPSCWSPCSIS